MRFDYECGNYDRDGPRVGRYGGPLREHLADHPVHSPDGQIRRKTLLLMAEPISPFMAAVQTFSSIVIVAKILYVGTVIIRSKEEDPRFEVTSLFTGVKEG